ncbi:rhomboid family intramembrane serine protease [Aquisphaera insulae]|uniref:rhomboid family intramembrane serine protease n=1 Tax=Aquisphaera insulae TaxID=2712864 RepID=UPI0013EB2049|nr:rhomboid family intramembrane serine protease [Aquisphaera insulae]
MVLPLGDLERTRITPFVTYALIAANVAMFLLQENRGEKFTMAYACTPWEVTHADDLDQPIVVRPAEDVRVRDPRDPTGRRIVIVERPAQVIPHAPAAIPPWMTLLTCMFLHGGWMHLLGNMLYLWIVGDNVEEVLGPVLYVVAYLACGLAGSLAQIAAAPNSQIPTLGASGAIAGIMGAYVVWFPHNQMRVLVFRVITVLPAIIVIGGWIALQVISGAGAFGSIGETGGVAYLAHIGGALAGIVVAFLFMDRARYVKARNEHERGWSSYAPPGY